MPELPEVETVVRDLRPHLAGRRVASVRVSVYPLRRGWSVAVLERERAAWNASSRNAGFVRPGFAQDIATVMARVGVDHARYLGRPYHLVEEPARLFRRGYARPYRERRFFIRDYFFRPLY